MDNAQWENMCQRCGRCCYEKIDHGGKIYVTDIPCNHLNLQTKECRIYAQRCQRQNGCVALTAEIIALGVLPVDCPYVAVKQSYNAPLDWQLLPEEVRTAWLMDHHEEIMT